MNVIADRKLTRERAVEITIGMMLPIFDKLQQGKSRWVQLMRKHLPINRESGEQTVGVCGNCSQTLRLSNSTVSCSECDLNLPIPYGKVTLTDHICPICKFPCLSV